MRSPVRLLTVALAVAAGCGGIAQTVREEQERHRREERACERGDGNACLALGQRELEAYARRGPRQGRPLVLAGVRERLDRGCALGVALACLRLAETWLVGTHPGGTSAARALAAGRRACDLALAAGCLIADRATAASDRSARRPLLQRACDLDGRACPDAASRAATVDVALMVALAGRPCALGLRDACAQAADLQWLTEERRAELYTRACTLDALVACVRGGQRVERRNPQLAERLFRRACAAGDDEGCGGLGRVLSRAEPE